MYLQGVKPSLKTVFKVQDTNGKTAISITSVTVQLISERLVPTIPESKIITAVFHLEGEKLIS